MTNGSHRSADFSTYCSFGSLYSPHCKPHWHPPPKILIERVVVQPIDSAWHAFLVISSGWDSVTCGSKYAVIWSRRHWHYSRFVGLMLFESGTLCEFMGDKERRRKKVQNELIFDPMNPKIRLEVYQIVWRCDVITNGVLRSRQKCNCCTEGAKHVFMFSVYFNESHIWFSE